MTRTSRKILSRALVRVSGRGRFYPGRTPIDPHTFTPAAIGLLAVALAARWFPARHATKVDPRIALRAE